MPPIPNPGDFNLQNSYAPPDAAAGAVAPHMHAGWADLRNAVNRHLTHQLGRSDSATRAAYRVLAQRGKRGHR